MSYVTTTFLLVSSSVSSKPLLCTVHGQGQKREQKHTTKTFVEFHNHCRLLTMVKQFENVLAVESALPKLSFLPMHSMPSRTALKFITAFLEFSYHTNIEYQQCHQSEASCLGRSLCSKDT